MKMGRRCRWLESWGNRKSLAWNWTASIALRRHSGCEAPKINITKSVGRWWGIRAQEEWWPPLLPSLSGQHELSGCCHRRANKVSRQVKRENGGSYKLRETTEMDWSDITRERPCSVLLVECAVAQFVPRINKNSHYCPALPPGSTFHSILLSAVSFSIPFFDIIVCPSLGVCACCCYVFLLYFGRHIPSLRFLSFSQERAHLFDPLSFADVHTRAMYYAS